MQAALGVATGSWHGDCLSLGLNWTVGVGAQQLLDLYISIE